MKKPEPNHGHIDALRDRAKALLARQPKTVGYREIDELIDELAIHQIELELQNEELRRTQNEVSDLSREYVALYDFAPVGYITLNDKKEIQKANLAAATLARSNRAQLVSVPFPLLVAADSLPALSRAFDNCAQSGEDQHGEIQIRARGAEPKWVRLELRGIREPDGAADERWRLTLTDISDQKRAEETAQANAEETNTLMREVQHRVKNDIQMVISFLHLQANDTESGEARAALAKAQERLTAVALVYGQLYRRGSIERVNAKTTVTTVVAAARLKAEIRGLAIETHLEDVDVTTNEAVTIGLIVNELLTNAIKHGTASSPPNTVTLSLVTAAEGREVHLHVEDCGPGYPQKPGDKPPTGFGMTVVGALADHHNGTVLFANTGRGARASVVLEVE